MLVEEEQVLVVTAEVHVLVASLPVEMVLGLQQVSSRVDAVLGLQQLVALLVEVELVLQKAEVEEQPGL